MESKIKRTIAIFLLVCFSVSVTAAAASANQWTKIGGPGKVFAADMNTIYGISPEGSGVYKYTGTPMKWQKIGGPADQIYAGGQEFLLLILIMEIYINGSNRETSSLQYLNYITP